MIILLLSKSEIESHRRKQFDSIPTEGTNFFFKMQCAANFRWGFNYLHAGKFFMLFFVFC